jgi:nitrate reductase gamma subunit
MIAGFIDGSFWYFSLAVFTIGVIWKLATIVFGKRKVDFSVPRGSAVPGAIKTVFSRFVADKGMVPRIRLHIVAGYMFHLGLFALLFFATPHVKFLEEHFFSFGEMGFSWTPMPHWAFIVASEFAFLGLLMLWLQRVLNPVSRLISTADDHISAILTFVVMLTGCMALLESFNELRLLHRFCVELLLIYFPFSRLMHAFTFIPSRAFTGAWFGRRGIGA